MKIGFIYSGLLFLIFVFSGCGSAKGIKNYHFPVTKYVLEKAVMKVINSNSSIYRDSSHDKTIDSIYKNSENQERSINDDMYFNDLKNYVTFKITVGETSNTYTFRYLGDESRWKNSTTSEIFITYARDKYGNSLSQGHDENGEFTSKLAKDLTAFFEAEFVNKVERELNVK